MKAKWDKALNSGFRRTFIFVLVLLTFGLAMSPFAVYAASESEPNNKLGLANVINAGEANTGVISPSGDVDFYKITLATRGRLECSITNPPPNIRAYIELYNKNADYLYVRKSAVNDGDDVHLTYDVVDPGTYFVRVTDLDGNSSDDAYTFLADFTPVIDAQEPNNELGRAFLITGTSITGTAFDSRDKDFFKIYVETGDTLTLTVDPPSDMAPYIELYDPNLSYMYVREHAVNPGDTVILEHTATVSGMYYIRLSDYHGGSHTDSYTMTISGGSPGFIPSQSPLLIESEDNNQLRQANLIDLNTSVSGAITDAGDDDWYKLEPAQPGQLTIELTGVPTALQLRFRLYDSSRNHVLSGQATAPGELFSITYDITNPDTYYLLVDDLDSKAFSGDSYRFSTSLVEVIDQYEPNDNYGDARLLNQQNRITAYVFKTGDQDWYRVNVSQPGDLTVILSDLPENIRPQIDIYNLSKEHLAGKSGSAGVDLRLVFPIVSPGTYFVKFTDHGNNDESTAPYTLTMYGADFAAFAPTAQIDLINPGSIIVGDTIEFTGSGFDSDGTITGYSWRSDIDGVLSDQATFTTSALSIGTHKVYFKVQDNDGIWSTEVDEVVYVGSSVSDEVEPNSPIGLANEIALDRPVLAKINEAGDADFFKVYIDCPGHLNMTATNVPNNLRLYLEFYNRHLDYLYVRGHAASDGDNVSLDLDVSEPGFYYLRVTDYDGDFNAEYTYTLTGTLAAAVDPQEPNGSLLDAYTLAGTTIQGYIFPAGDKDFFRVWVDAGSTLTVDLTNTPDDLRPYVQLYDRNRGYMYVLDYPDNEGDPVQVIHTFNESGYVYILVEDYDGDPNWTQMYQLTVSGANPGYTPPESPMTTEQEGNDVIADANLIAFGSPVSGTIGDPGDNDWFKFIMPCSGIIHTHVNNVPINLRGRVRLYQDDGSQISYREATNPGDELMLDTRVTRAGTYFIRIDSPDWNESSDQPYCLSISTTPAVDNYEPNDLCGDATIFRDLNRIQALIFNKGDKDVYRVTSDAGSVLKVTVADVPEDIRPQIEIFDNSWTKLSYKLATNDGQELTLSQPVDTTADYFIRIRDVGDNSFSTDPYTLIIDGARFNSFTPLASIDSVTPNPADSGQTVTFEGHGEDADGDIIGYAWRSSIDGNLSSSRVAALDSLSTGIHTIYFKVKDNDQNWSSETSTILYYGLPAPQEEEPNNAIGEANPIDFNIQYSGTIDPGNDSDYFRIHVTQPGRLTITATNPVGSGMRTCLETYNTDADYSYVCESANNAGDPVTLHWNLSETGYYFLRVTDHNNQAGSEYTITASLEVVADPYEPNHDEITAAEISAQDTIQGYIFPGGDADWYKVTVETPGLLNISLTNMPDNLKGYIETYDRNTFYTWVREHAQNDAEDVFLAYQLAAAGTYFIRISDYDGDFNAGATYTLRTNFQPTPDQYEPNNDVWHSTPLATSPIEAYVFPDGDKDFYKFYAENGATLRMTADNVPQDLQPYLELYNPNTGYMYVSSHADTKGDPVTLEHNVTVSGYYCLKVSDYDDGSSAEGPYRLSISGANLSYSPSDQPAAAESEPNDEFKNATLIGTEPVSGSFVAENDSDWFRFEVDEPCELTVSLTVPSTVRSVIKLFDANKSERTSRAAENKGDLSQIIFAIDEPGIWYIRIYDADGTVSEDFYTLTVSLDPAYNDPYEPNPDYAGAAPITFGEEVRATIFSTGDQDWYRMEVEKAGLIRLELSQVPENIEIGLALYDQDNNHILSKEALNAGDPLQETYLAPSSGTYYVKIYDRGDNDYSVMPYTLTAGFTPMEDPSEPNDRFSQATELAEKNQVSGIIYPENDKDWYRFSVEQAGTLRVQLTQTDGIQARIRLYTDSKTELKGMVAENKGDVLLLIYEITEPDIYYLLINDDGDNDYSFQSYVLTIEGGAFTTAYPIASIDDLSPNPAIQDSPVTLSGSGTDEDGFIVFYEWSSDRDGALGNSSVLTLDNLSEGAHRIALRVQDDEGNWSGRVYKHLYITDEILSESEYNNVMDSANPVPLDTWLVGNIYPKNDADFYKIYLDRRGYISALVDPVPQGMEADIEFWDQDGDYLYERNSANNPGDRVSCAFYANTGWHYVKISDNASGSYQESYGLLFSFKPAPDIYEPNDSPKEATWIDPDTTIDDAYICQEGDGDWYRVEVTERGRLSLSLTNMPENMRGKLELSEYNLDYMYVQNHAFHGGDDVFLQYDIANPGIYYIKISDYGGSAHDGPYTFTSQFTPVTDPYENNYDATHATLLPGSSIEATVFPGNDQDWFKIYASEGSTLSISVTEVPAEMRAYIQIWSRDVDYKHVYEAANNKGDDVFLSYDVPSDGVYYIRITDYDGRAHLMPYQMTVTGGTPNYEPPFTPVTSENEPNGSYGDANDIGLDTDVTGTIDPADDYDWYRFYVNSAGIVVISHTDIPGEITSEMWVYNANKEQIDYRRTTEPGEDNVLTTTVTDGGYYFVRLADYEVNNSSSNSYTLHVTHTPVVDGNEPNDNYGPATQLGQDTDQGYIFDKNDEDWYRVYVREPGTLSVSVDEMAPEIKPYLRLYDADKTQKGSWLATNDGQTGSDVITYEVEDPGFYFVRIYDEGKNSYSGSPYTLRITGADFSTAPVLEPIGHRTIDEAIKYAFTVYATDPDNEQDLSFSATNLPNGASFDPATRTFEWTPAYGQAGTYSGIHFEVSDGIYSDSEDITITVNRVSRAPVLAPVGDKTVGANTELTFQISATDPDTGDTLTYTATGLPYGAEFTNSTRTFSWTPTEDQVGVHSSICFEVTDGTWTDFEYINIEVTAAANVPTVTTAAVTDITQTGATAGGDVTSDGGAVITERGVVYSTSAGPTIDDTKVLAATAETGAYTVTLTGLASGTKYYVRAYATNSEGTGYGDEVWFSTSSAETVSLLWHADLAEEGECTWSTPIVVGGKVFMQDQAGGITCFRASDGEKLWYKKVAEAYPQSSPVYRNGKIFMLAGSTLYRLNPADGSVEKEFVGDDYISSQSPAVSDDLVYFSSGSTLYAIDADTFEESWSKPIGGANIIINGETVLVFADKFYALNATNGDELWQVDPPHGDSFGIGALSGDIVAVFTNAWADSKLHAYRLSADIDETPTLLWSAEMGDNTADHSPPAICGNMVYGTSRAGVLRAFALEGDGTPLWEQTVREDGMACALPIAVDGKVFVQKEDPVDYSSALVCLEANTGDLIWETDIEAMGIAWGEPVLVDNVIYLACDHMKGLYAFDAGTVNGNWYMIKHNPDLTGSDNGWAPVAYADFTAEPTSGIAPLSVTFADQSVGEITVWSWDFGDATTSAERNPTHIYTKAGAYTVTLTVTGTAGSYSETKADYITVNQKGDINGDYVTDLADAILASQVLSNMNAPEVRADYGLSGVDVNSDNRIGIAEVIYILQVAAGIR